MKPRAYQMTPAGIQSFPVVGGYIPGRPGDIERKTFSYPNSGRELIWGILAKSNLIICYGAFQRLIFEEKKANLRERIEKKAIMPSPDLDYGRPGCLSPKGTFSFINRYLHA
jgi:hypothetical protein